MASESAVRMKKTLSVESLNVESLDPVAAEAVNYLLPLVVTKLDPSRPMIAEGLRRS
jgi:hypothetical protein